MNPTKGTIEFEHKVYEKMTPKLSMDLGISVIYQEFSLIPYLTVAENIFLMEEKFTEIWNQKHKRNEYSVRKN